MFLNKKVWVDINTIVWDALDKQVADRLNYVSKYVWDMVEESVYDAVGVSIDSNSTIIEIELKEYDFKN